MKIRPVGAELFHAKGRTNGRTDTTKLVVAFRDCVNVPKRSLIEQTVRTDSIQVAQHSLRDTASEFRDP
jgi:hypothetical protein